MSKMNVNDLFKKYAHGKIERMARNHNARFVSRRPGFLTVRQPRYDLIEEYHITHNDEELALYGFVSNMDFNKASWDLHYDMRIGDTSVHINETNTEFAKKIQQLIYDKYVKQNVK